MTAGLAWLAGAGVGEGARLGLAMLLIQASIGAVNDWHDAAADGLDHPGRPVPAGLVRGRTAALAGALCGMGGLALAADFGPAVLTVAAAGYACGLAYDLHLKPTAWAWIPFALGFALVPAFAWLAATGTLPGLYPLAALLAIPAGAALALANGAIDAAAGPGAGAAGGGPAWRLGPRRAVVVGMILHAGIVVGAGGTLAVLGRPGPGSWLGLAVAAALAAAGLAGSARPERRHRQRGWEVQALAVAVLAVVWIAGLVPAGT